MELVVFVIWIVLCFVVGGLADARGRSGVGFFFLSLILSPLIGLVIVLAVGRTPETRAAEIEAEERLRAEVRRQIEQEERAARTAETAPGSPAPRASRGMAPREWRAGED